MKAVITGASSGLGKEFCKILSGLGYELIIVSRNKEALIKVSEELKTNVSIYSYDLSVRENVFKFYDEIKNEKIDIFINNAGFGVFGEFSKTDLDKELNLIDLNVASVHILTKLILKDMIKNDSGHILNVSSLASFMPGPLLSSYYASKSYVRNLSMAIYEELRRNKSNVKISVLCPGPVTTKFNDRAHVNFKINSLTSEYVCNYAIKKMFKNKLLIIPGMQVKFLVFINRILSRKSILKINYNALEEKK